MEPSATSGLFTCFLCSGFAEATLQTPLPVCVCGCMSYTYELKPATFHSPFTSLCCISQWSPCSEEWIAGGMGILNGWIGAGWITCQSMTGGLHVFYGQYWWVGVECVSCLQTKNKQNEQKMHCK